jgi:DNA-binding GntR family transcriptional regulator
MSTKSQASVEQIMLAISEAIVDHRLPPGTRLIEAKLVKALDANRNHVRAALQRLATEDKVITIVPNKGAVVAQPSVKEAKDIFEARRVVERAVVSLAAEKLTPKIRNQLKKQLDKEKEAINKQDKQRIIHESGRFHTLLAEICGNDVLADVLDGLIKRSSLIIALYQEMPEVKCSNDEHQAIVDALFDGDLLKAQQLSDQHMHTIEGRLLLDNVSHDVDLSEVFSSNV